MRDRRRVQTRGHEPREVRHVHPEHRAHLVGDRAERLEVELPRVGRPARDDHVGAHLERPLAHRIHVDARRIGIHAVRVRVVELAREVELHAVREVAALVESEAEDAVAGRCNRAQHSRVRLGTGVRLHIRVRRAEQVLGAADCQRLHLVDELAAAVVAAAGVSLGVLVRQHGAGGLEHGTRHEVLARDHLERRALAVELLVEPAGDLGVDLGERGVECGRQCHGGSFKRVDVAQAYGRRSLGAAPRWLPISTPVATRPA